MKIKLIEVGRNKVTKEIEVKNFEDIYKELDKCLASRSIELFDTNNPKIFDVVVGGFRTVGQAQIIAE